MTPEQMEMFQKNPRFIGMRFPDVTKPETIEKKYLGKLSKKALSFMKACLQMDPAQRIISSDALQHPYFDGLRENDVTIKSTSESRVGSAQTNINSRVFSSAANGTPVSSNKFGLSTPLNAQLEVSINKGGPAGSSQDKKPQVTSQNTFSGAVEAQQRSNIHTKTKVVAKGTGQSHRNGSTEKSNERSYVQSKASSRLDKLVIYE